MKKFIFSIILPIAAFSAVTFGQTLNLTTTDDIVNDTTVILSDNSLMPAGNWVSVGLYDTVNFSAINADFQVDQSELAALFGDYNVFTASVDGGTFGTGEGDGLFSVEYGSANVVGTEFENQVPFLTVFKTADNSSDLGTNWSNVTEIGVYSSSSVWNFGTLGAELTDSVTLRAKDADLFLVGSNGSLKTVSVVPEPAHLAAVLGLFGLAFAVWRRRR